MGNTTSVQRLNFEDIQYYIELDNVIIINTLPYKLQNCLIKNTIPAHLETDKLNTILKTNKSLKIIIYGMNSSDETIISKYNQLISLGFNNISIYSGGLFEWLLLQDIYGDDLFKTTTKEIDILKYKGEAKTKQLLLNY